MTASIEYLKIKGAPKSYTIKLGETLTVEEEFPKDGAVVLTFVNGNEEGLDVGMPNGGRRFVPSFSGDLAGNELILAWSNMIANKDEPEGEPVIKVKSKINLKDKTISVEGEGFTDITVEVVEFESPEKSVPADGIVESHAVVDGVKVDTTGNTDVVNDTVTYQDPKVK